jgi:protein MPE1
MAAMFQAQSANWEETQEKMSQLVSPLGALLLSCSNFSNTPLCPLYRGLRFFSLSPPFLSQTRVYTNARGTGFGRGGKAYVPHHQQNERPLPPSYVCYRCGQKGMLPANSCPLTSSVCLTLVRGHWIQDCPTNSDREFDNKPRIKRTTGIPRSFLKAVDNPNGARIGQGVMVTPEGGFVVAQPDS